MLSSNLQSILDNRLRYLPEITGKAIQSVDWSTKIIEIGHKYGLHIDDIEELQMVVLKSMTGLLSPADFESNLISATAASPTTAEKMIMDMNTQIFEPIHQFVMSDGKAPDPLLAHGIELQPEAVPEPEPSNTVSQSFGNTSFSGGETELEIPASPEPKTRKPQVPGSFDSFFVNVTTGNDGSVIK